MRWIVTDDIYTETWRQLLEFSNYELTLDLIRRKQRQSGSSVQGKNLSKQATQARVCVLQAKEYFDAAQASSLFTSANHAYYGSIALASLVMLVLGDGTKSLDYLRKDNKNNHHGLNFTTGCTARTAVSGIALLEHSFALTLRNGHYSNWYRVLPSKGRVYAFKKTIHGATASNNYEIAGEYTVPPFDEIVGSKKSILSLLKYLPDLDADLGRSGIAPVRSRTTHEIDLHPNGQVRHRWRIHGCRSKEDLESLLEEFEITSRHIDSITREGPDNATGTIVTITFSSSDPIGFRWPNSRESLNQNTYSYVGGPSTHEITDIYQVAYQLSMLSRYFPDIWVACIESQCRAAKLIERATEIVVKKLPILALSMLCGDDVVISTHREPWLS